MIASLSRAIVLAGLLAAPVLAGDIGIADHEVTGERDTAIVVALDVAVDRTAKAVGACREAGGDLQHCLCSSRAEIAGVRAALDRLLGVHPEWKDKTLFVRDKGNGQSLTIFLDTVARQAKPPDCP
jgi:hypothetical protein